MLLLLWWRIIIILLLYVNVCYHYYKYCWRSSSFLLWFQCYCTAALSPLGRNCGKKEELSLHAQTLTTTAIPILLSVTIVNDNCFFFCDLHCALINSLYYDGDARMKNAAKLTMQFVAPRCPTLRGPAPHRVTNMRIWSRARTAAAQYDNVLAPP